MTRAKLEKLNDEHAQAMFGYLHNLTRDMEETRDLLQELFVILAKKPPELDKINDPRAF